MLRISRACLWLLLVFSLLAARQTAEAANGLSFLQSLRNGLGELDNLRGVSALAVSPDGKNVYAAAPDDDALVVFSRSPTGRLSFLEAQVEGTNGVEALHRVRAVTVSPDGTSVYTASSRDDAIAVFRRDPSTGALTFVERKRDAVDDVANGLDGASAVTVSPDSLWVYACGYDDDAIVVFARDPATGALTFVELQMNNVFGVQGLNGVRAVTVSPDGTHLYAAADRADSLTVFRRNVTDGKPGLPLSLTIAVVNAASSCAPVSGATVEIWQCDHQGVYSEYGQGTGQNFLRGAQTTDAQGQATFDTVYPGWYQGRATHVHVEVTIGGRSVKVTQIAFPEDITAAVYRTGVYAAKGQNSTTNGRDGVFADGVSQELISLSGNTSSGFSGMFQVGIAV